MRLLTLLALLPLATAAPPPPKHKVDLSPFQGLTSVTRPLINQNTRYPTKYFYESSFSPHYDGRFAADKLPADIALQHLRLLIRTYLSTMASLGAETWIMHGSLLGWWWARGIMPWDTDVDVQVSEDALGFLARWHNMTVHHFAIPGEEGGRNYLLEVNPHWGDASLRDRGNVIDARWIDMSAGLFIDITALRRNRTAEAEGKKAVLWCKDRHRYREEDVFPLRESVFEGVPVMVPYAYTGLLEEEYGGKALTRTLYKGFKFEEGKGEWVRVGGVEEDAPKRAKRPLRKGPPRGGTGRVPRIKGKSSGG